MSDGDAGRIYTDIIGWLYRVRATFMELVVIFDNWYRRRRLLTRAVIGAFTGVLLSTLVAGFNATTLLRVQPLDTNKLLIALIGVVVSQTAIQRRTLNRVGEEVVATMDTTDARPDGGNHTAAEPGRHPTDRHLTTGGGALGGAIIGGALGSAYGATGTVTGAVLGAVVVDWLEEQV